MKSDISSKSHDVEDDFDPRGTSTDSDFDPRGSSTTAIAKPSSENLFSKSLLDDLIDINTDASTENGCTSLNPIEEVDLFADASFISASPSIDNTGSISHSQESVDLFAHHPVTSTIPPPVDLFSLSKPALPSSHKASFENIIDPFASVPLANFQDADVFGAFTSSAENINVAPSSLNNPLAEPKGNSDVHHGQTGQTKVSVADSTKSLPKKDAFQVKSSIWADSLSCGLIDLNISAPKKVSLAEIGIVGGLDDVVSEGRDEKDWASASSFQMGKPTGTWSGLGGTSFPSTTGHGSFPDLSHQFGSFK